MRAAHLSSVEQDREFFWPRMEEDGGRSPLFYGWELPIGNDGKTFLLAIVFGEAILDL